MQVETSCTYGNGIAGALSGGLNYQIEHHLFPRVCSAHYPALSPLVRAVCARHNVSYTVTYIYVQFNSFVVISIVIMLMMLYTVFPNIGGEFHVNTSLHEESWYWCNGNWLLKPNYLLNYSSTPHHLSINMV
jgi:hypothetical protein